MREQLARDFERFSRELPREFPDYVRERYRIDLSTRYLGFSIPHPVGKGSGQLSLNQDQLEADQHAGVAFVVLKTVIAEDAAGERTMGAWAIHETRMKVERCRSVAGREGWTVTWKGRGWDRPFDDYLTLVRAAADLTRTGAIVAVPSVKYHLPRLGEAFRDAEYEYTTQALSLAWGPTPLPLEKDFSPTLAGDQLADEQAQILRWLREVPARIRAAAPVRLALKLMNARHGDDFQLQMVEAARQADTLVLFNRLWSAEQGSAYGGHDLSDRNLRVLGELAARKENHPPLVGTGNVCSGRILLEYARLGCESVQLHTLFQLPLSEYPATSGSRQQRALHLLYFHPADGVIAGMLELEACGELARSGGELRFRDLCRAS